MTGQADPILTARDVEKHFPIRGSFFGRAVGSLRAVDGVDLDVQTHETLGLVGESGCGKSTLGRTLIRLHKPTAGQVRFDGEDLADLSGSKLKRLRRDMQIVFQDPVGSLDPRFTVRQTVAEGLDAHLRVSWADREARVVDTLASVGLPPEVLDRYPHEFSGGQRQRIGIARALILKPRFIVLDEPVSALDVSVQSQVLNLLVDLKHEFGLTYLFIAHNLAVVGYISDRIAVMYLGKVVELAASKDLFESPLHPYTTALLSAIPQLRPGAASRAIVLEGDVPSPARPPSGCRFRTRCPLAQPVCAEHEPALVELSPGHKVACHFAGAPIPPVAWRAPA